MSIVKQLTILLSNHIEGSLAVRMYHWNVEGTNFVEYHNFFSEVYDDYNAHIDKIAEFIRISTGAKTYVEMLSQDVHNNKTIDPDHIVGTDVKEMINQVEMINRTLIDAFTILIKQSQSEDNEGLANYCGDRLEALTKLDWKLKSMSK